MADHYFESKEHEAEFLSELESGEISLKWAYSGSAATTHDLLAASEGYTRNVNASAIEAKILNAELHHFEVVDIGPGNALHTTALWNQVHISHRPDRYLLLDFSGNLVALCKQRLASKDSPLAASKLEAETWDFESQPTAAIENWRTNRPVRAMMIGHTLGNPRNPAKVLSNIVASLRDGDQLLISVALHGATADVLAGYENEVFRTAATEPFRMMGLDVSPADLQLTFDDSHTVRGAVFLTNAQRQALESRSVPLRDNPVTCFRSKRFSISEIEALVSQSGLQVLHREQGNDTHLALLCRVGKR